MIKDLLVADRYAQALFEIAREMHKDEEVEAELENLSAALKADRDLERSLGNPYFKTQDKRNFLHHLYQERKEAYNKVLLDFFTLLFQKNRFNLIHEIAVSFKRIADEAQGQGIAEIRSATALKPEVEKTIVSRLESLAGYKLTVKKEVDPTLIGGVVVKIKNKIIDGSVKYRIESIKKELTKNRVV